MKCWSVSHISDGSLVICVLQNGFPGALVVPQPQDPASEATIQISDDATKAAFYLHGKRRVKDFSIQLYEELSLF